MKVLISGVAGFIFYNFINTALKIRPDIKFVGVDSCEDQENLDHILPNSSNYKFYLADITQAKIINNIFELEKPDIVIHGAARSFVCSSIENPLDFVHTNIVGTQTLVDASVKYNIKNFVYISSDEVYGSLALDGISWTENSLTNPSSPYSSSKLGGEHIVRSANKTFGLNYNITRCCNIYGEHQQTRNLIPKIITSIKNNKIITLHDKGEPIREWMYVQDKISAILTIIEKGKINETYNIGSGIERENIEVYYIIANMMGRTTELDLNSKRLGQDMRYSVDCSKLKLLGWKPKTQFGEGLQRTIESYDR
jgi:dTDP-glucose 4,6-dehydratase